MLPIRVDLSGDPNFSDLVVREREAVFQAFANQDIPFEQIVDSVNPTRSSSFAPLVQVVFILQNAPMGDVRLPGLEIARMDPELTVSKFDLTLCFEEKDDGLIGYLEYSDKLFERTTALRMIEHYKRLLEGVLAQPEVRPGSISLLNDSERQQLLNNWNVIAPVDPDVSVVALFERQARTTPERAALLFYDGNDEVSQMSYDALRHAACRIAAQLPEVGVYPGDMVGVYSDRSPQMIAALLGILYAGAVYVSLDPSYPEARRQFMIEDAGLRLVLTVGEEGETAVQRLLARQKRSASGRG